MKNAMAIYRGRIFNLPFVPTGCGKRGCMFFHARMQVSKAMTKVTSDEPRLTRQLPVALAIGCTIPALIAEANVITVEYNPIMKPMCFENWQRTHAGMMTLSVPVAKPIRIVPINSPATPHSERTVTPIALTNVQATSNTRRSVFVPHCAANGDVSAKVISGMVVRKPAMVELSCKSDFMSEISGPTLLIAARIENASAAIAKISVQDNIVFFSFTAISFLIFFVIA